MKRAGRSRRSATLRSGPPSYNLRVKRPLSLFLAFFAFLPAVFVVLGLWRVDWSWAALPGWYWGVGLLFGLLCMAGMFLTLSAKPHLPFKVRMLRVAAGWGLPFLCFTLSADGLRGNFINANLFSTLLIRISIVVVISLGYGYVMATVQQRKPA